MNAKQKEYIRYNLCDLIEQFELLIDGKEIDASYQEIFEYFGYVENGKTIIPVFDRSTDEIVENLNEFVLSLVGDTLKNALLKIASHKNLLAIQHEVDVKDIANEIYHLIFGEVNEQLVQAGIVEKPPYIEGEGRYLQCYER